MGVIVNKKDRQLGMDREITRRDFLNGVAVGVGGAVAAGALGAEPLLAAGMAGDYPGSDAAPEKAADYYPPAKTGMRGNHDGTFTYAHLLRDGMNWNEIGKDADTRESYDLVVVGGGISGLAAAYFYRQQAGAKARILILDNHDDFGGHAKRNEFQSGGRMLLGYGGTQSIAGPNLYSAEAKGLFRDLGIEPERFSEYYDTKFFSSRGLTRGAFFDKETFGTDRLVPELGRPTWQKFLAKTPLSKVVQSDIARLYSDNVDYLPTMDREQKKIYLAKTSYKDFLLRDAKVSAEVIPFFQKSTYGLYGVGIDAVPAGDLAKLRSHPGFAGMDLSGEYGPGMGLEITRQDEEPYIYHFPDGNASIARLLVRALIPGSAQGSTMEDIVLAKMDYAELDKHNAPVRVRLNSTVVHARNVARDDDHAGS